MRRIGFICQSCLAHAQKRRPRPLLRPLTRGITSRPAIFADFPREANDDNVLSPSPFEPQNALTGEDIHPPDNDVGEPGHKNDDGPKAFPKIFPWLFSPEEEAKRKRLKALQRQKAPQRQNTLLRRKASQQKGAQAKKLAELYRWKRHFSPIAQRLVQAVSNPQAGGPVKYVPRGADLFELLMEKSQRRMSAKWMQMTNGQRWGGRRQRFYNVMLDALHIAPDRAHKVFHATFDKTIASPFVTQCFINLFVRLSQAMKETDRGGTKADMPAAIDDIAAEETVLDTNATKETAFDTDPTEEITFDTNPTEETALDTDPTETTFNTDPEETALNTDPTEDTAFNTDPAEETVGTVGTPQQYGEEVVDMVIYVLENSGWGNVNVSNKNLFRLSRMAHPSAVAALYQALKRYPPHLTIFSRLQFAGRMAMEPSHKPLAAEILRDLIEREGVARNSAHIAALVTAIFTFSKADAINPDYNEIRSLLFEEIMALGVELNLVNYTALIRNLCLSGEMGIALQVSEVMRGQGIEPDEHLLSVLIHGAKLAGDWSSVQRFTREIAEMGRGVDDPIIYNDLIHCLHCAYLEELPPTESIRVVPAFPSMLQAYAKFFNLAPLQRLLPMHDLEEMVREAKDSQLTQLTQGQWIWKVAPILKDMDGIKPRQLLEPRPDTMQIMLLGYLGSLSNVYHIVAFYINFRKLIKSNDPLISQIVEGNTTIHDRILMGLIKWPGMLRVSMELVNDMLRDAIKPLDLRRRRGISGGHHPAPSAYTWSILLKGMGMAKEIELSIRLLDLMRAHDFQPCSVLWNVLIGSYARAQDVQGTINALDERKRAGFEPNEHTYRALSRLPNKVEALELVKSQSLSVKSLRDLRNKSEAITQTLRETKAHHSLRDVVGSVTVKMPRNGLARGDDGTVNITIGGTE